MPPSNPLDLNFNITPSARPLLITDPAPLRLPELGITPQPRRCLDEALFPSISASLTVMHVGADLSLSPFLEFVGSCILRNVRPL